MLLAVTTDDVGFMWVAIEGTTLASVFLVNFERTRASLEASYKYLLICSVGIAVAFLGTVLVYFADVAALRRRGARAALDDAAARWRPGLPPRVVELAFVFLARRLRHQGRARADAHVAARRAQRGAGAGERAHVRRAARASASTRCCASSRSWTWRPGPASPRGCLLAASGSLSDGRGGRCSCGRPPTSSGCSPTRASSTWGSSCLGLGFGGPWGVAGAILHIANHALAKSVALPARGPDPRRLRLGGASRPCAACCAAMPRHGRGFLAAMLALMGLPPFGLFVSEVMIFGAGFAAGRDRGRRARPRAPARRVRRAAARAARDALRRSRPGRRASRRRWARWRRSPVALALLVLTGLAWPPGLARRRSRRSSPR